MDDGIAVFQVGRIDIPEVLGDRRRQPAAAGVGIQPALPVIAGVEARHRKARFGETRRQQRADVAVGAGYQQFHSPFTPRSRGFAAARSAALVYCTR